MKVDRKKIGELEKCYSMTLLDYNNSKHIVVATEKIGKCFLFDLDGNLEETIWDGYGGTMSIVQVPGSNGQFLATHKFYSPNDSKNASIVVVSPKGKDYWEIRTLVNLPFVHRFDIITRNGINYLIVCTIKSGHEYKDDWTIPGKVYSAVLPDNLEDFNDNNQLQLEVIKDGMSKNHGYYRYLNNGSQSAVISCEQGVFHFVPPANINGKWTIEKLISTPASDALLLDFDNDGIDELVVFSPFHGDNLIIYKKDNEKYTEVFSTKMEFLHAIYGGLICGKPMIIVGHRGGKRNLIAITYNDKTGNYDLEILDTNAGAANVITYKNKSKDIIIATNREINEITMYTLQC
ncbi:hypothetical protein Thexy_2135 [Thermoanaerobacterium xylanolyticum LX-11]|uniref:FG-GAP repeat protein n=1 Tax=Thermoanaerobacterium xylanolyticum (strain ATCC 49914 / DSM 7097 / LX-11) TaxID=858215 RepID=F6BKR0_THEXL|nr:hypothetical protein [Thermoanaerobacterium xylanolyticum]AEF18143.1 hypothetical protein Thexy_2135 [Thermoanaerobacterium xylanolyticum LX-11]